MSSFYQVTSKQKMTSVTKLWGAHAYIILWRNYIWLFFMSINTGYKLPKLTLSDFILLTHAGIILNINFTCIPNVNNDSAYPIIRYAPKLEAKTSCQWYFVFVFQKHGLLSYKRFAWSEVQKAEYPTHFQKQFLSIIAAFKRKRTCE